VVRLLEHALASPVSLAAPASGGGDDAGIGELAAEAGISAGVFLVAATAATALQLLVGEAWGSQGPALWLMVALGAYALVPLASSAAVASYARARGRTRPCATCTAVRC
jgi:hypothetical protein